MLKKLFYSLLCFLLFILILEHFIMSSIFSAAFNRVTGNLSGGGHHISEGMNDYSGPANGEYGEKLEALSSLPKVYKKAEKEIRELEASQGFSPQAAEIKNYLEWLFSIPWLEKDDAEIDLKKAKEILDRDHQGLAKIKEHILEYLAVQKRAPNSKAPILCFVGPPGVGKTTLAKSIAEAMDRKFVRVSLGGVRDEASIRGFMRTYVSSKPGKIVEALKEAGTRNPVILLDEVEKLGQNNHHGDPAAALLEVLDPAQNGDFKDHYLELGVDLSQVTFIATANSLDMHPALLDRLEIVELSSYTPEEKASIAQDHLIPKALKENGLNSKEIEITEAAIKSLIHNYTFEAGVRNLKRAIDLLCRKVVKKGEDGETKKIVITPESLHSFLGKAKVPHNKTLKENTVGVAQGLAATGSGGEVMRFEVVLTPGKGNLIKTGNLGKSTQESITAACTTARLMLTEYKVDPIVLTTKDIHVHSPRASKKDGNSAGITFTTALVSALTNIPVNKDVCMTGEITVTGQVLAIGGVKEKLIGAYTAGMKTAIIPEENIPDLEDVPQNVKEALEIVPVNHIRQALKIALVRP